MVLLISRIKILNQFKKKKTPPIIIGGVGGSGTRLIAQILMDIGYYFGNELNESNDNLWYMLLFKRVGVLHLSDKDFSETLNILVTALSKKGSLSNKQKNTVNQIAKIDRNFYNKDGFQRLAKSLINNHNNKHIQKWGWKEPNSHIVIKQIRKSIPDMKYIHVIRNGLDMAFSDNQNQLKLWGKYYIESDINTPRNSLKFWCVVHKKLLEYSQSMQENFYLLNFDDFCENSKQGLQKLEEFLKVKLKPDQIQHILSLVNPLKSVGRYKRHNLSIFDKKDIDYVKQLGFDTQ